MDTAASVLGALMMICFGFSWPFSVIKSYKARTTKGKSFSFLIIIWSGYIIGIVGKSLEWIAGGFPWPIIFYIINFIVVSLDLIIYFRNLKLDKLSAVNN